MDAGPNQWVQCSVSQAFVYVILQTNGGGVCVTKTPEQVIFLCSAAPKHR